MGQLFNTYIVEDGIFVTLESVFFWSVSLNSSYGCENMPRYRSAVYFGFSGNNSGNVQRFFICLKYLVVRNIHLWILYISTVYLMIFLSQKLKRRAASQYIHTYTGCKMFWIMKIKTISFLMFLEEVSSSYQGCNYLIKTTVKYMLTYYYCNFKYYYN